MGNKVLSILIPTVVKRTELFKLLLQEFLKQRGNKPVELLFAMDNKQLSIGKKRQSLLDIAKGEWIVFFDDDDWPAKNYIDLILEGTQQTDIDCMGLHAVMTTNGQNKKTFTHRLGYPWAEQRFGFDYIRPINHLNPVKREKALQAGFKDLRYGEDRDYADRLNPLLTKEYFIAQQLLHYRYTTKQSHAQKYGFQL